MSSGVGLGVGKGDGVGDCSGVGLGVGLGEGVGLGSTQTYPEQYFPAVQSVSEQQSNPALYRQFPTPQNWHAVLQAGVHTSAETVAIIEGAGICVVGVEFAFTTTVTTTFLIPQRISYSSSEIHMVPLNDGDATVVLKYPCDGIVLLQAFSISVLSFANEAESTKTIVSVAPVLAERSARTSGMSRITASTDAGVAVADMVAMGFTAGATWIL